MARRSVQRRVIVSAIATVVLSTCSAARAQVSSLSNAQLWFIKNGLQLQGLSNHTSANPDPWDLTTFQNANYTTVNWLWDSATTLQGNEPWARWVRPPGTYDGVNYPDGELPPMNSDEAAKMGTLIALSLGDEPNLNDDATRQSYIDWFNRLQASGNWTNQLLYMNNYGGQVTDAPLADFVVRAKPDMISFDTYPYAPGSQPAGGSPTNWYGDLRRYRQHAISDIAGGIPLGMYRQTFHEASGPPTRDPSESELRLMTFAGLAFNAKYITDFTYNTGASSMYSYLLNPSSGDPTFYNYVKEANRQARNLGPALVRLKPVNDTTVPNHTSSIMFVRGQNTNSSTYNSIPVGFVQDPSSVQYTDWTFGVNDPYLSGFTNVTNNGTKNGGLRGDMIVSWFTPSDEWFDGDDWTNEKYLMVVNGLADLNGTAADCRQTILLDFNNNANTQTLQTLDPTTGVVTDVNLPSVGSKRRYTLTLDGGSAMLFKFKDGAPFVGTMPNDAIWKTATSGAFQTGSNWDVNLTPSGNYYLHFGSIAGGAGPAYTASLTGSLTVKGAFVHNANVTWNLGASTLTLGGFSGVDSLIVGMRSGESGSLTLSNGTLIVSANAGYFSEVGKASGATGVLTLNNGASWINTPDVIVGKLGTGTINVNAGATANLPNVLLGGTALASGGIASWNQSGGNVTLSGTLKIWPNASVNLTGGSLSANLLDMPGGAFTQTGGTSSFNSATATGAIIIGGGASPAHFSVNNLVESSMTINAMGKVSFNNAAPATTSRLQSLSIAGAANPTGTLDLNAGLVIDYTGTSPLAMIRSQIAEGYGNGLWTGPGITSASAASVAADSSNLHKTAVGYAEASAFAGLTTFLNQPVDTTSLLLRYTYSGDSNLDGQVNAADFTRLAQHFAATGANWSDGDFSFDGVVNALDFNAIASNFGRVMPAPIIGSLVPEPGLLGFIVIVSSVFGRRTRAAIRRRGPA